MTAKKKPKGKIETGEFCRRVAVQCGHIKPATARTYLRFIELKPDNTTADDGRVHNFYTIEQIGIAVRQIKALKKKKKGTK